MAFNPHSAHQDYIPLNAPARIPGIGSHQKPNGTAQINGHSISEDTKPSITRKLEDPDFAALIAQALEEQSSTLQAHADHSMTDASPGAETPFVKSEHNTARTPSDNLSSTQAVNMPPALAVQPQFLLFGKSADDLDNIIPKKALQNIPEIVLRHLAVKGFIEGPSISMQNYDQVASMTRMKEFLDGRKYTPFKPPRIVLEHILPNGTTSSWEPSAKQPEGLAALNVTETTHDLLRKEIDLYFFAKEIAFDELRRTSMINIVRNYPKSLQGVWILVEKVFMQSHPEDEKLRQHVIDLINANRNELTSLPSYVKFMRHFVKTEGNLGRHLLDAYIQGFDEARRKVIELSRKEQLLRSRATNDSKEIGPALRKDSTTKMAPHASPPSTPSLSSPGDSRFPANNLRPIDLHKIADAINKSRLLVAKRSGYGTLVRGMDRERNRDFQFEAGELFLTNPYESAGSNHNVVVYNTRGERGDILRDLVAQVPQTLGISPREREWECLHESKASPLDSSSMHPDREQRLYRSDRRRSRSPPALYHQRF